MESAGALSQVLERYERPVLFLAHQDDEMGCTWILQRLRDRMRVVFMTNGDGLAPAAGEDPVKYAEMRKQEARGSLETAGLKNGQVRFLGHSEIEIYRNLAKLKVAPRRLSEVMAFFEPIRRSVAEAVNEFQPDAVFTVAYQGGHPEHDLVHYLTSLALRNFQRDAETEVPLYHFPEYELTILIPMRFRPWFPGEKHWLELTPEEGLTKKKMAECYPSQRDLIRKFRRVVGLLTLPLWIVSRENPIDRFFSREQISRVPADFDYRRPPYRLDFLNYVFEDFQGVPISFQECLRPLVVLWEDDFDKRSQRL